MFTQFLPVSTKTFIPVNEFPVRWFFVVNSVDRCKKHMAAWHNTRAYFSNFSSSNERLLTADTLHGRLVIFFPELTHQKLSAVFVNYSSLERSVTLYPIISVDDLYVTVCQTTCQAPFSFNCFGCFSSRFSLAAGLAGTGSTVLKFPTIPLTATAEVLLH